MKIITIIRAIVFTVLSVRTLIWSAYITLTWRRNVKPGDVCYHLNGQNQTIQCKVLEVFTRKIKVSTNMSTGKTLVFTEDIDKFWVKELKWPEYPRVFQWADLTMAVIPFIMAAVMWPLGIVWAMASFVLVTVLAQVFYWTVR